MEVWIWRGIGLLGQGLFFSRFLVQWIASERRKESVISFGRDYTLFLCHAYPGSYFYLGAVLRCFCLHQKPGIDL